MEACAICNRPFGQRRRCYYCVGKSRTGETRNCLQCGKAFYVEHKVAQKPNAGKFCSMPCYRLSEKGRPSYNPQAKTNEKTYHSAGYLLTYAPDHPRANTAGRVLDHILVMEEVLGRSITRDEEVHHLDQRRDNNDPSNLIVLTSEEHARLHARTTHAQCQSKRVEVSCVECGQLFMVKRYKAVNSDPRALAKYCSLACRHKGWARQMVKLRKEKRGKR